MRLVILAAATAALAACNMIPGMGGGSGPPLPRVQQGAQAPSTQTPPKDPVRQGQVTNEVRQQLRTNISQQLDQIATGSGMAPIQGSSDDIVEMQPATDHRAVLSLTGGQAYAFIGACDGDCTNVDIELIDMTTGGVVASDVLPDDYPVVNYTPQANGQYMVRLLMQSCTTSPCFAGTRALTPGAAQAGGK